MANVQGTVAARFWKKVTKGEGCWLWTASTSRGYGQISPGVAGSPPLKAHRVSWEIANGPIPEGLFVCHRCDNPRCVRPDHLFLGSNADNAADMKAKCRANNGYSRRTHCPKRHPYSGANLFTDRRGWRKCRTCEDARSLARSDTHYTRSTKPRRYGVR
jgi:hypothetical protein